jgi:ABC-type glycerol-3-phosphate transport system substrate-binding protein
MTNFIAKKTSRILLGVFSLTLVLAACNGSGSKKDSGTDSTKKMTQAPTNESMKKMDDSLKPQPTDPGSGGGTPK